MNDIMILVDIFFIHYFLYTVTIFFQDCQNLVAKFTPDTSLAYQCRKFSTLVKFSLIIFATMPKFHTLIELEEKCDYLLPMSKIFDIGNK